MTLSKWWKVDGSSRSIATIVSFIITYLFWQWYLVGGVHDTFGRIPIYFGLFLCSFSTVILLVTQLHTILYWIHWISSVPVIDQLLTICLIFCAIFPTDSSPDRIDVHDTNKQVMLPSSKINNNNKNNNIVDIKSINGISNYLYILIMMIVIFLIVYIFTRLFSCWYVNYEHYFKDIKTHGDGMYFCHPTTGIPTLILNSKSPKINGEDHGYLRGPEIARLSFTFQLIYHGLLGQPRPTEDRLSRILNQIWTDIPDYYQEEMVGLLDGYLEWRKDLLSKHHSRFFADVFKFFTPELTLFDFLLFHLLADSKHLHVLHKPTLLSRLVGISSIVGAACTTILYNKTLYKKDSISVINEPIDKELTEVSEIDNEMYMGRNLDWLPFGTAGSSSCIIIWNQSGIAALGVPGLIGITTGWNKYGICAAMNVCPGDSIIQFDDNQPRNVSSNHNSIIKFLPAVFLNRLYLEKTFKITKIVDDEPKDEGKKAKTGGKESKDEAEDSKRSSSRSSSTANNRSTTKSLNGYQPLGPYHLVIMDKRHASHYAFYQSRPYGYYDKKLLNDWQIDRKDRGRCCGTRYEHRAEMDTYLCKDHLGNTVKIGTHYVTNRNQKTGESTFNSVEREIELLGYFHSSEACQTNKSVVEILKDALGSRPYINSWITLHSMIFDPTCGDIYLSFGNGFAGQKHVKMSMCGVFT
jgi:hypothetical protein